MRTLIVLVLLGALVVVGGAQLAEAAAREAVDRALADSGVAAETVDVDLGGPFVVAQLATGEVGELRIRAEEVALDDASLRLERVSADLRGVSFSLGDLLDGGTITLQVEDGWASATVAEEELRRLARSRLEGTELTVDERGVVLTGEVLGRSVEVVTEPRVSDGSLVLVPREVGPLDLDSGTGAEIARRLQVTIPLPELPLGAQLSSASTSSDALTIEGRVPETVTLPAGEPVALGEVRTVPTV